MEIDQFNKIKKSYCKESTRPDGNKSQVAEYMMITFEDNNMSFVTSKDMIIYDEANSLIHCVTYNNDPYSQMSFPVKVYTAPYQRVAILEGIFSLDNFDKVLEDNPYGATAAQVEFLKKWAREIDNQAIQPMDPHAFYPHDTNMGHEKPDRFMDRDKHAYVPPVNDRKPNRADLAAKIEIPDDDEPYMNGDTVEIPISIKNNRQDEVRYIRVFSKANNTSIKFAENDEDASGIIEIPAGGTVELVLTYLISKYTSVVRDVHIPITIYNYGKDATCKCHPSINEIAAVIKVKGKADPPKPEEPAEGDLVVNISNETVMEDGQDSYQVGNELTWKISVENHDVFSKYVTVLYDSDDDEKDKTLKDMEEIKAGETMYLNVHYVITDEDALAGTTKPMKFLVKDFGGYKDTPSENPVTYELEAEAVAVDKVYPAPKDGDITNVVVLKSTEESYEVGEEIVWNIGVKNNLEDYSKRIHLTDTLTGLDKKFNVTPGKTTRFDIKHTVTNEDIGKEISDTFTIVDLGSDPNKDADTPIEYTIKSSTVTPAGPTLEEGDVITDVDGLADALETVSEGHTVYMNAGTYDTPIFLKKSVKLAPAHEDDEVIVSEKISIDASANKPAVSIDGLKFTGKGLLDFRTKPVSELTLTNCEFSGLNPDTRDQALYMDSSTPVKVTIKDNTVGANTNIYNLFNIWVPLADGSEISGNTFAKECCGHNIISLYRVEEGANVTISGNHAEMSANMISVSMAGSPNATLNIDNNTYDETDPDPKWAGLMIIQTHNDVTVTYKDLKVNITSSGKRSAEQIVYFYKTSNAKMHFDQEHSPVIKIDGEDVTSTIAGYTPAPTLNEGDVITSVETITNDIDTVGENGTLYMNAGTYAAPISLKKNVTLAPAYEGDVVTVTAKIDVDKSATKPAVTLRGLKFTGDGLLDFRINPVSELTLTDCDFTGLNPAERSQALYMDSSTATKVTIKNNTIGKNTNIYNFFNIWVPFADGSEISGNNFAKGCCEHNIISLYRITDDAKVTIKDNHAEMSDNLISVSMAGTPKGTLEITGNSFDETNADPQWAGLMIIQTHNAATVSYKDLKVNISDTTMPEGQEQVLYFYKTSTSKMYFDQQNSPAVTIDGVVSTDKIRGYTPIADLGDGDAVTDVEAFEENIEKVEDGGTLYMASGSYTSPISLKKNITLAPAHEGDEVVINSGISVDATANKPKVALRGLKFTDKGLLDFRTKPVSELSIVGCDFTGLDPEKSSQALYMDSTDPVKVTIKDNTIGVNTNIYNFFNIWVPLADGSEISGNAFEKGCCNHNIISLYRIAEDAKVTISGNHAKYSDNMIFVSMSGNPKGTIEVRDNSYDETNADPAWAGLMIIQTHNDATKSYKDLTVNISGTTAPDGSDQIVYFYKTSNAVMHFDQNDSPTVMIDGVNKTDTLFGYHAAAVPTEKDQSTDVEGFANALEQVQDGGTLYMKSGTYTAPISIKKNITLAPVHEDDKVVIAERLTIDDSVDTKPAVAVRGLTFSDKALIDFKSKPISELSIIGCTFTDLSPETSDQGVYVVTSEPIKVTIKDNTVGKNTNVYNFFNMWVPFADGSEISGNTFKKDCCTHNIISLYKINDGATLTIKDNYAEYSGNMISVSIAGSPSGTIEVKGNRFDETSDGNYAGLMFVQTHNDATESYKNLKINISETVKPADDTQVIYFYATSNAKMKFDKDHAPTVTIDGEDKTSTISGFSSDDAA